MAVMLAVSAWNEMSSSGKSQSSGGQKMKRAAGHICTSPDAWRPESTGLRVKEERMRHAQSSKMSISNEQRLDTSARKAQEFQE